MHSFIDIPEACSIEKGAKIDSKNPEITLNCSIKSTTHNIQQPSKLKQI